MALVPSIILFFSIIMFFFGQLLRLNIGQTNVPVFDICLFLLAAVNLIYQFKKHQLRVKNIYFLFFTITLWLSFITNLVLHHFSLVLPALYLLRLTVLTSFFIFPLPDGFIKPEIKHLFGLAVIANIVFGFIQYLIWPDFTYFSSLNWDPHLYRLVSTYFDPTFTALIYLFFIIYVYLSGDFPFKTFVLAMSYVAMVLTYSRSTFLAFILAFAFIAYKKKSIKIFLFSSILMLLTIISLPRMPGEGTKLERTSSIKAKIQNYQDGISLFQKSPIIGFGYDNLFYVRQTTDKNSHAVSGFDSSLMTILTTTGIFGLIFFVLGISQYFLKSGLIKQVILLSLLFHSLFANSLLYPWVLFFLFIV